jgi:16S rRNA (uracil1498-N3)-methyltransferase
MSPACHISSHLSKKVYNRSSINPWVSDSNPIRIIAFIVFIVYFAELIFKIIRFMHIFYTPDISSMCYRLSEDESKHAIRVLRLNLGDTVALIDGKGTMYKARIADPNPKRCEVIVEDVQTEFEKRSYQLHIAISPLKNADRFEWFIEKATEIGIDTITPLLCGRTEKKGFNLDRCNRIIESAMKQSIKAYRPLMNRPVKFPEFIKATENTVKIIACCEGERELINKIYKPEQDVVILIGPEGDFTPEEIETAKTNGYIPITMGNSRLRTETAGIVAVHTISHINLG